MPFVRFSRDRRGYEHVYLVHTPVKRGKSGRPRVLYWYRSPPGVKVGREAFDEGVRRALALQHPDLTFDWEILAAPPPPPPAVEPWRERRRLQKARKARAGVLEAEEAVVAELDSSDEVEEEAAELQSGSPVELTDLLETDLQLTGLPGAPEMTIRSGVLGDTEVETNDDKDVAETPADVAAGSDQPLPAQSLVREGGRRRRGGRGRRRGRGHAPPPDKRAE